MPRTWLPQQHCFGIQLLMLALVTALFCTSCTIVFLHKASETSIARADTTLQLLHVILRHGERTPVNSYPLDPHRNASFAPYGWGQLTNRGKSEMYSVGKWLSKRYGAFLRPYYHPDFVHAQAMDTARTLMSLQTVLASLYPAHGTAMAWHNQLNWQPIPIVAQNLNADTLLLVRTPCPRYHEAYAEVLSLPEIMAAIAPHRHLYAVLSNHTGLSIREPAAVQSLYWTLLAEQDFGLTLPAWAPAYFPHKMQQLAELSYIYKAYTLEMQKIKAGPFLKKLLSEVLAKRSNTLQPARRKLYIYATHDSTLVNILMALKLWQQQMPGYAAMLLFELHKHKLTDKYFVELRWRRNATAPMQKLPIPGCGFQCGLDEFIALTRVVVDGAGNANLCTPRNDNFIPPPAEAP